MTRRSRPASGTAAIVEFLRRPESYPEWPGRIAVIETHFAWIFLGDAYAYKLKKPFLQDCMDYRSLAARRRGCRSEVRLNRRLAPAVYLEAVPITRERGGTLVLGRHGTAPVVDWLVKMRRLPAHRMLDSALAQGRVRGRDLDGVALKLTRFFASARPRPMSGSRYIARLRRRIRQEREALCAADLSLDTRRVDDITGAQLAFVAAHRAALGERAAHLIDGHGDLRPEHLFLGSTAAAPCVIDCLEFNSDLRWLDPAEEMAFLALECRRLRASGVARALLTRDRKWTRAPASDCVLDFYMSLRALTRAKLTAWHVRDPQFARRAALWRSRADSYLADAARYLHRAQQAGAFSRDSTRWVHGPSLEQRGERLTRQDAAHGLAE